MSVSKSTYVVLGYDFTNIKDEVLPDDNWIWSDVGEEYSNSQREGNIQLFCDPMNGGHLYFGYIVTVSQNYGDDVLTKISIADLENQKPFVDNKLNQSGLNVPTDSLYGILVFSEWY